MLIKVWHVQVDWMLATELIIDFFFLLDIVLNFNTGYIADQVSPFACVAIPDHPSISAWIRPAAYLYA